MVTFSADSYFWSGGHHEARIFNCFVHCLANMIIGFIHAEFCDQHNHRQQKRVGVSAWKSILGIILCVFCCSSVQNSERMSPRDEQILAFLIDLFIEFIAACNY